MFILILTLAGTLLHLYLSWHILSLPRLRRHRRFLLPASALLWLLYLLGSVYGHDSGGGFAAGLERLAMDWLGVLFIGTVVMLAVDLLSLAAFRCPGCRLRLRYGGLFLVLPLLAVALVQGGRAPVVTRYEVVLEALPAELDGTTVAALSDLHLGSQLGHDWFAARVGQVEQLEPDLIVLLGDNFEGHGTPDPSLQALFARLRAPLGVFAVTGNHEYFGDPESVLRLTRGAGLRWLRDERVVLRPGLTLAGVDDLISRRRAGTGAEVFRDVLDGAPPGAVIVLSHSPLYSRQAALAGADLMLSGHNHGGQIWPFGYLVERFYPYLVGRHRVDGMVFIISRGTGLWGPRMRLWHPGEILLLTLRAGPQSG